MPGPHHAGAGFTGHNLAMLNKLNTKRNKIVLAVVVAVAFVAAVVVSAQKQIANEAERITVSGVSVKNPRSSVVLENEQGDIVFNKSEGFEIVYLPRFKQFLISITAPPFDENVLAAEQEFLGSLGISEAEACKLNVVITTPQSANPNEAGKDYGLSFCK